ncbi:PepSY domain-containing protein [Jeotgalibacillus haloalkalitolerans]|uniref:PepSY domain-containing protein n=1 Tax=Jeotgalibacillus haloalkalitolerans TaxID=3104292 RepID=A0ABU5KQY4_9BACL|nr:PepSY domain-containing protein [Jeotgalibacillus sp. HH7-29]MDZ5713115.1 PepSY domain-containing protein [Jeotgalibacillus sp. HH7-29]
MNRKLIGGTIAGAVILGGAFGADALADQFKTVGIQDQAERTENAQANSPVQQNQDENLLTLEEAKEKALSEFEGVVESIELERQNGRMVYDIDIDNGPEDVDLDMDAVTGEVLRSKTDWDDDDDRDSDVNSKDLLSKQEALDIATAEFTGKPEEIELDDDDGKMIYEIELKNGEQEAEFDIDAVTGDILNMEFDD